MSTWGNIGYGVVAGIGTLNLAGGIAYGIAKNAKTSLKLLFLGATLFEQGVEGLTDYNVPGPADVPALIHKFVKEHPPKPLTPPNP